MFRKHLTIFGYCQTSDPCGSQVSWPPHTSNTHILLMLGWVNVKIHTHIYLSSAVSAKSIALASRQEHCWLEVEMHH